MVQMVQVVIPTLFVVIPALFVVIPAEAGIQNSKHWIPGQSRNDLGEKQ
jgi:hypothetical protein